MKTVNILHGSQRSMLSFDCEGDKLNIKRNLGDYSFIFKYFIYMLKIKLALRYSNAKRCILPLNEFMTF